jgi:hypothetical protein
MESPITHAYCILRLKQGGKESKVSYLWMLLIAMSIYLLDICIQYIYLYVPSFRNDTVSANG